MDMNLENVLAQPVEELRKYKVNTDSENIILDIFRRMNVYWSDRFNIGYCKPLPNEEELNVFYGKYYRSVMGKRRDFNHYIASPNYRAQTYSQLSWVKNKVVGQGQWLDVGAGFGLLLSLAKQELPGWAFCAIEPDEAAFDNLRKIASIETDLRGFLSGNLYEEEALYDVISVSHVLEHLIDPFEALSSFYKYLKPGGYLMVEVPNDNKEILTDETRMSDLPHLWFFSMNGLRSIVENAGFVVDRCSVLGVKRPGFKDSSLVRLRRSFARLLRGPLANLSDVNWYAESDDRCDIRILCHKPVAL